MGGRYGGNIRGSGRSAWSRKRALETVGEEARRAFGWKPKDNSSPKTRPSSAEF